MGNRQLSAEEAITQALRQRDSPVSRSTLKNADLVKLMAVQLEQTMKLAQAVSATGLTMALAKKGLETSKAVQKSGGSKPLKVSNFFVDEMLQTLSLLKLAGNVTPGKVYATVGTMFVKKVAIAFKFGGSTAQQQCVGAWADLAGAAGVTFLAAPTALTPVTALILVASVAQLGVAGYNAYQCIAPDAAPPAQLPVGKLP